MRQVAATAADLKVQIPATARKPCEGANLPAPPKPGEADYQVFGVQMVGKLDICEDKRALAVEAGDLHNRYVDKLASTVNPPSFWERVFGQ